MNPSSPSALQLLDIHLPAEPGWWPPAPGWWILAVLLLILLVWTTRFALRRYRLYRQRQRLLATLDALTRQPGDVTPETITKLSILLRRLALMRFPRQQVAALSGSEWLDFLDRSGGDGGFSHGPGQVLATGPYQPTLPADVDMPALSALLHAWIKKNMSR